MEAALRDTRQIYGEVGQTSGEQSSHSLLIHSEVTIFYFFKCHSCIMGKEGVGWAVALTILITLELFYSTKRIQRVAVSPHRTTKVINRAINKIRTSRRKWNTRNDKDEIENKRRNWKKNTNIYYQHWNTECRAIVQRKGSVTQKANAFSSHIYNIDIYILSPSDWTITKYSILLPPVFSGIRPAPCL